MSRCPVLSTDRLVLRPFVEDDLDAYTTVLQSEPVRRSLHLPADVGRDAAWEQMAAFLGQWELRGTGQWALEERATGAFVGRAGLHQPERRDWPGVEIGWTLHPDVWGRGYATEAGAVARDYAFTVVAVDAVVSLILEGNVRSQAVARRLGLAPTVSRRFAFFPDEPLTLWRRDRADWAASHAPS